MHGALSHLWQGEYDVSLSTLRSICKEDLISIAETLRMNGIDSRRTM